MLCKYPSESILYTKIINVVFISAFLLCSVPGMNLIEMLSSVYVNTV